MCVCVPVSFCGSRGNNKCVACRLLRNVSHSLSLLQLKIRRVLRNAFIHLSLCWFEFVHSLLCSTFVILTDFFRASSLVFLHFHCGWERKELVQLHTAHPLNISTMNGFSTGSGEEDSRDSKRSHDQLCCLIEFDQMIGDGERCPRLAGNASYRLVNFLITICYSIILKTLFLFTVKGFRRLCSRENWGCTWTHL